MKQFGLIGEKLGHSFSPQIHSRLHDYDYRLYEIPREQLPDFLTHTELSGFNVTIPYKEAVIPFCRELSPRAEKIGSVNTMIRQPDGSFFGENTDYYGFDYLLRKSGFSPAGKKALILGSGGASKTVKAVLEDMGAASVVTVSRSGENHYGNLNRHRDAALIVNTTPVGMYPHNGEFPLDLSPFSHCKLVLDLIYNPHKTALLLQAEKLGISGFNGLSMLTAQAKKAGDLFTDTLLPESRIDEVTEEIETQTGNIVLIGMPGCGKSTVGKVLAALCSREFIDLDEAIVQRAGCSIPAIFAEKGESGFRALETDVLKEISRKTGTVIASGGGIVTIPENLPLLKQNSRIVLLERAPEDLPSEGRPLSQSKNIRQLYEERQPLYLQWCDFRIENTEPLRAARSIQAHYNL